MHMWDKKKSVCIAPVDRDGDRATKDGYSLFWIRKNILVSRAVHQLNSSLIKNQVHSY